MTNRYLAFCVAVCLYRGVDEETQIVHGMRCVCVHVEAYILDGHLTWTNLTHRFGAGSKEERNPSSNCAYEL
jgi:hypothetical protein